MVVVLKRKVVRPYQGSWETLKLATAKPELLFRNIEDVVGIWHENGTLFVKIKGKRLFLSSELKFKLQRVENKPSVLLILSGSEGTLVLTITIKKDRISCEGSWNGNPRVLKETLGVIVEGVFNRLLEIVGEINSVSQVIIQTENEKVRIEDLTLKYLPTVLLYAYLLCPSSKCGVKLEGALDELFVTIGEGKIENVEYSSPSTTFTTRLEKDVLFLVPEDFEGMEVGGMYTLEITPL